jgi:hypothetical protein
VPVVGQRVGVLDRGRLELEVHLLGDSVALLHDLDRFMPGPTAGRNGKSAITANHLRGCGVERRCSRSLSAWGGLADPDPGVGNAEQLSEPAPSTGTFLPALPPPSPERRCARVRHPLHRRRRSAVGTGKPHRRWCATASRTATTCASAAGRGAWQDVTAAQFLGEVRPCPRVWSRPASSRRPVASSHARARVDCCATRSVAGPQRCRSTRPRRPSMEWILSDLRRPGGLAETPAPARIRGCGDRRRACTTLVDRGGAVTCTPLGRHRRRRARGPSYQSGPDSLATLIYTSGTTVRPKAACSRTATSLLRLARGHPGSSTSVRCVHRGRSGALHAALPAAGPRPSPGSSMVGCVKTRSGWPLRRHQEPSTISRRSSRRSSSQSRGSSRRCQLRVAACAPAGRWPGSFSRRADVAIVVSGPRHRRVPLPCPRASPVFDRWSYTRPAQALGGRCAIRHLRGAPLGDRLGTSTAGSGSTFSGYGSPKPVPR